MSATSDPVTVYKLDHAGRESWQYTGVLLSRTPSSLCIEARFNRPDRDLGYTVFRLDDRFIEWFYADRWFNIFEVHDVADDHLKGWYCNITRPAKLTATSIHADDLALDLWVYPDGRWLVLDEDEFAALPIDPETRQAALDGLTDLQRWVTERVAPFDQIAPTP